MWTPRRIVLLFGGLLVCLTAYAVYARFLGWLDGLPQLPDRMLKAAAPGFMPPERPVSPTELRLIEAFGPECPERGPFYPTKLEFRNGESSVVLASGTPPFNSGSNKVVLTPFSLAVFGKPRPVHLRKPGEVTEISTFHADRAVLEFDRPIGGPNDMSKAKLLRLELVSEPDPAQTLPDPRRGTVHVVNNQRSADPNDALVLRTPGPVFYRDPKNAPGGATGPDVWTDAAVEITDRRNLPRPVGVPPPGTAAARGDDLRAPAAVPEILTGRRLPPPTITAVGLRLFLEPENKAPAAPKKDRGASSLGGVRRVELQEKVLINLWTDDKQGFVGPGPAKAAADKPADPPAAFGAIAGGPAALAPTLPRMDKALLQIETLGPFAYDVEKNTARFDVVPQANPNLPNDVQVTRVPPRGVGQQKLFSQVLEIEFNGPPTGTGPAQPPAPTPAAAAKPTDAEGPAFKQVHAWTFTPGRYLTVSSEGDQLEAYGTDLVHDQAAGRTTLQGAPLYAVRERNVLTAGGPGQNATLVLEPGPGPEKAITATVRGFGRIELFDPAANANTIVASWRTSLVQAKEVVNRREVDVFTFTDDAAFEDKAADYWLRAKVLRLWLESGKAAGASSGQPLPHRLQALGDVTAHSADFDIDRADHLNVMFRDATPPPAKPAAAAAVAAPGPMGPPNPTAAAAAGPAPAPPPAKEPPKPKPPMKVKARVIDTWVDRYPVPKAAPKPADPKPPAEPARPGEGSVRYDLTKARCEGNVSVHQDPEDRTKPRGVDILGDSLLIDHTPDGSVMTVAGTDERPGEVHQEGVSIIGPVVVVDQLHNLTEVAGRGALQMPAGSDLAGGELKQPEVLIVHWRDRMRFSGAKRTAEFLGKVSARQGDSWVLCHTMQVVLDRPVFFNQMKKPPAPAGGPPKKDAKDDSPKVETVFCYPAPEDAKDEPATAHVVTFHQVERDAAGNVVKTQQLTAGEMVVKANAVDAPGGQPYQQVDALGPGNVRIWQRGEKETAPAGGPQPQPQPGAPKPKEPETEMKLTVVTFAGKMTVKDKGKVYQEATFYKDVQAVQVPTDDPAANVERHRLPARSVLLTCADRLVVSSHRQGNGPPAQGMRADGNSFIRSDEYDGWGEVITFDGRYVVLEGTASTLAQIRGRYNGNSNSGKRIVYDRKTGNYKVDDSFGGSIESGGKK